MTTTRGAAVVIEDGDAQTPREAFLMQQLHRARADARRAAVALAEACEDPSGLDALSAVAMAASLEAADLRAAIQAVRLAKQG